MKKTILLIGTAVAGAVVILFFLNRHFVQTEMIEEQESPPSQEEFVELSKEQIQSHAIALHQAAPGVLQKIARAPAKIALCSDNLVHIIPRIAGFVLYTNKNLGEKVEAGEMLAVLESREIAEAKAAYLSALKKEKLTSTTFAREQKLYEKKISTAQDYYIAENNWEEAVIDAELARQKLHAVGINEQEIGQLPHADPQGLRLYELHSPISGTVISRHVTPGEFIDHDREIYAIADLNTVWAEISLSSKGRIWAKEGQTVRIKMHDGVAVNAKLIYLSPTVDEETCASQAIAEIDNSSGIWIPGMFASAELIVLEEPVSLAVPKEAIHNIDGIDAVFIVQENGFEVRPVRTGRSDEKYYEILSGINPGEFFAGANSFLLKAELKKDEAEHMD
jgi:cobalt-zinc-cadmium efflux system membrane fusion protein